MIPARLVHNIDKRRENLERLRTRNLAFAMKAISDHAARELVYERREQARQDFTVRRKSFPGFKVVKAAAGATGLTRRARVVNTARLNDILRLQIRGGIRRPGKKKRLLILADRTKWGRKSRIGRNRRLYYRH